MRDLLRSCALLPTLVLSGCTLSMSPLPGPAALSWTFEATGLDSIPCYPADVAPTGQAAKGCAEPTARSADRSDS